MGKHKVFFTVIKEINRPDQKIIDQFRKHSVATIGDAMGGYGILHHEIKPIATGMKVLGPACTVLTKPGDALFLQKVADVAQKGDVVVVDAGGVKEMAVFGERIAYYMKEIRDISGIIIDGGVRDIEGIRDINFPTFSRSITPRLYSTEGPGAINVPIQCGGVNVNPGDLILGDDDGVIVIPQSDVERVLDNTNKQLEGELERLNRVKNGELLSVINNCDYKIEKWLQNTDN